MANHCIDCQVCHTDLRGSGPDLCRHAACPGWVGGDFADLDKIAHEHPDPALRARALELRGQEEDLRRRRSQEDVAQTAREQACPEHEFEAQGGLLVEVFRCKHCGKREWGDY